MTISNRTRGILAGLLAAVTFTAYVSINRYVYTRYEVETLEYTATFSMAGGLFAASSLILNHFMGRNELFSRYTLPAVLNGLVAGVGIGLVVFGQAFTTAVNTSIIMTATILTTVLFAWLLLKDRLTRVQGAWLVVMFVGLYFAIVGTELIGFRKGDIIILAAVFLLGFTNNFAKILMRSRSHNFVTDVRIASAGLLFAGIGAIFYGSDLLVTNAGLWPLLAGLIFWLTIRLAYTAIDIISPSEALILANIHPFFTAVVGIVLLAEPYNWVKFIGSLVILVSVYFISRKTTDG